MLGSLHDAEDAVQESLLRAWRYRDTVEPSAPLRSWLYRVATNVCLDIIARDGACLVVCEVKTRRGTAFGDPVEAVTVAKALRLRRLTRAYLRERGGHRGPVRIDVVGVLCESGRPPVIRHVRGVGS